MNNFYNSTDLCLLKKNGVNVAGALQLNGKNIPLVVKAKLKQGKHTTMQSQGVTVMKWMDKKPMSFIHIFHSNNMVAVFKKGRDQHKQGRIQEYNLFMARVDFKVKNCNMENHKVVKKLLKRLLNTLVHNAFVLHRDSQNANKTNHLALDFKT
jgi:hypothetical protein